jgi:hypothetical protein
MCLKNVQHSDKVEDQVAKKEVIQKLKIHFARRAKHWYSEMSRIIMNVSSKRFQDLLSL